MSIKIVKEEQILDGFLKVVKADIEHTLPDGTVLKYNRSKFNREDAVAIVVENKTTGKLIFVRQNRYAVADRVDPMILEIVAGRVEEDQSLEETAKREVEEEIGYSVSKLEYLTDYFPSPGYSSEKITIFYASVTEEDKISSGGGLACENEFIQIEEYSHGEVAEMLKRGEFIDGKSKMGLFIYFSRNII